MNPTPLKPRGSRWAARAVSIVAGLAAASLALSGCLYSLIPDDGPTSDASAAPDTDGVDAALLPFYEQELDWAPCDDSFECTKVSAPLDWSDPGAGEIELSVIRHRATGDTTLGSLLTNPGGPGASGVALVRDSLDFAVGEPLQRAYDVIGFDPRGVGESTAVTCYDASDMDAYLFDIPDESARIRRRGPTSCWQRTPTSPRPARRTATASCRTSRPRTPRATWICSAACSATAKLNYLGYSYGTFLGATYAKLFPERVGRLVLDGAVDPAVSGLDVSTTQGGRLRDRAARLHGRLPDGRALPVPRHGR